MPVINLDRPPSQHFLYLLTCLLTYLLSALCVGASWPPRCHSSDVTSRAGSPLGTRSSKPAFAEAPAASSSRLSLCVIAQAGPSVTAAANAPCAPSGRAAAKRDANPTIVFVDLLVAVAPVKAVLVVLVEALWIDLRLAERGERIQSRVVTCHGQVPLRVALASLLVVASLVALEAHGSDPGDEQRDAYARPTAATVPVQPPPDLPRSITSASKSLRARLMVRIVLDKVAQRCVALGLEACEPVVQVRIAALVVDAAKRHEEIERVAPQVVVDELP